MLSSRKLVVIYPELITLLEQLLVWQSQDPHSLILYASHSEVGADICSVVSSEHGCVISWSLRDCLISLPRSRLESWERQGRQQTHLG